MAAGRKRDPRERAEDGAARDPAAFQQSIRDDPGLMAELEGNPEAQKVLLGGDLNAMQDYLRSMHRASVNEALDHANRSSDAQRVDATVPRDSVQLYRKLHSMGLQYGPAFQLLQTVRVPEDFGAE
jgi:hypothetical protein